MQRNAGPRTGAHLTTAPPGLVEALADRYRLDREIGAGGMATVYLAYDLRHDRKVAVKVVRPELAVIIGGERFLAEIRTTANLQHPHILPLHDSGEADGKVFYVMPFVEGESLRARLMQEHQLPVDEAVRITREVASALDYAHRHGVVHRDIKPENILLHDGQALVADFGIALAVSRSDGGTRMTETGMSLGTPHYMAPEQAMGEREISPRADVYALGCVLYECLVGEPPFTGPTAQAIVARVMTEEPRGLRVQRRTIPANIEAAVRTALEKLPADRFPTAAAFGDALANPAYAQSGAGLRGSAAVAAGRSWDPRAWTLPTYVFAAATLAFAGIAAWLAAGARAEPAAPLPVVAFQAMDSVSSQLQPTVAVTGAVAWTRPEGIYVRPAGATAPVLLPGTKSPIRDVVAFSPDGAWLVYSVEPPTRGPSARLTVHRIAVGGGVPQTLTSDLAGHLGSSIQSAVWGADGNIYLGATDLRARLGSVLRVSATGGVVDTLLKMTLAGIAPTALLPGGRTLLFTLRGTGESRIMALDLRTRDTVTVLQNAVAAHWSPTGHVIAGRHDGTLIALPFDAKEMRARGAAIPVGDSVVATSLRALFSLSPNGVLAYVRGPSAAGGDLRLALLNVAGDVEYLPLPPTDHGDGSISPDGRRVAYTRRDQIWLYDLELGTHRQLTRVGSAHHNPIWSPDGKRVAFRADRPGKEPGLMYAQQPDGDTLGVLLGGAGTSNPSQWLPDNSILFINGVPNEDIMRLRTDGTSPPVPVLNADWPERWPRVSPDGRWIAFGSAEDDSVRVYVRSWPELAGKTRVSGAVRTNSYPAWSRDSRTLYVQEATELVAYALAPQDGALRVVGRRVVRQNVQGQIVAIHPDGRRLLHFARAAQTDSTNRAAPRMIVVANWHEVLRERLGSGRARRDEEGDP